MTLKQSLKFHFHFGNITASVFTDFVNDPYSERNVADVFILSWG